MATDIFKLREQGDLPIEQQDIPPDAEGQWRTDFAAIHGYTPTDYDKDRWQWSLRFANQYGRGPEREDWERNYYKEQTPKEKAIGAGKPEFVARTSSGVDRDRRGDLVVPFPWQADEPGAENTTDMTARFRQYDRWDGQRAQYARGTPEWNSLTTAMNQLQTSTAPWYFAFTPRFGLREEALAVAGNRSGQDRVQAVANWIRQKQGQGVDPFNQADPYTAAYKAQAAQAASRQVATAPASVEQPAQRRGAGGGYLLEASESEGIGPVDFGPSPTGPRLEELLPESRRFPGLEGETPATPLDSPPVELTVPGIASAVNREMQSVPPEQLRGKSIMDMGYRVTDEVLYRLGGVKPGTYRPYEALAALIRNVIGEMSEFRSEENIDARRRSVGLSTEPIRFRGTEGPEIARQEFGVTATPVVSGSSVGGGTTPPRFRAVSAKQREVDAIRRGNAQIGNTLQSWLGFLQSFGGR